MSRAEIISAYRQLYRHLTRAIRNTKPQIFTARRQLRASFDPLPGTKEYGQGFDREGIQRTVWFLKAAEKEAGMEHRVLKNLLTVAGLRGQAEKMRWKEVRKTKGVTDGRKMLDYVYGHYDRTVEMLNKTMGIRLK